MPIKDRLILKRKKHWRTHPVKPVIALFALLIFLSPCSPAHAQWRNLARDATTPCIADFEDFLGFAIHFSPTAHIFDPIFDITNDGVVGFADFLIFLEHYNQRICVPIDSLAVLDRLDIEQINAEAGPQGIARMTLPFSAPIRLVQARDHNRTGLSLQTPAIDLATGESMFHTLAILDTQADSSLRIETDGLIANGSLLSVDLWALGLTGIYQSPLGDLSLSSPTTPAEATLARRPFAPTDVNLFTPGAYPQAGAMIPASGDTLSETAARAALTDFLSRRGIPDLQNALNAFDNPILIQKMPDPTLRAGLVSLSGTLGEPAIDALTRGPLGPIAFGPVSTGDYVQASENGAVAIDQRYRAEAFPLFGPVFTRLSIQTDAQTGRAEEIATSALLALIAMQQALVDETLAQSGTELSRRLNTQMLARLNSGRAAFPNIGIEQIPNGEAFPGGQPVASYAAVFAALPDIATPASALLRTYLARLAPPGTAIPPAQTYDADVLAFLDRHQAVLSPEDLIRLARILNLK